MGLTYGQFKKQVLENCGGVCENPYCDQDATTVHHILKRSRYPSLATLPNNGVGLCGECHAHVENLERSGLSVDLIIPLERIEELQFVVNNRN